MTATTLPGSPPHTDPQRTAANGSDVPGTPRTTERWQPTRAGIDNIWRYYGETFTFADGRLLLRGRNGLGKSKALELLLPFLFDANLTATRLSTFGGKHRSMHWNLLGAGAHGRSSRVGFCWVEFTHPQHGMFTIGARLQASTNTTKVTATYFTTPLRIGDQLHLTDNRKPLTQAELADAIGTSGRTFSGDTAGYRRELQQTLFEGFTAPKFQALIDGLLQLRTPKLSEHLDPSQLSDLLSAALPPLDTTDVAEIAEGFERLDRREQALEALRDDVGHVSEIAATQRTYARRLLRRGAAQLATTTTQFDKVRRIAAQAAEAHTDAGKNLTAVEHEIATTDEQLKRLTGELEGLLASEAYRQVQAREDLRTTVAIKRATVTAARKAATDLAADADADDADATGADQAHASLLAHERTARGGLDGSSATANLDELPGQLDELPKQDAQRHADGQLHARRSAIEEVRAALAEHAEAIGRRTDAEERLEHDREQLKTATDQLSDAEHNETHAAAAYADEVRAWAEACTLLHFGAAPDELADLAVTDQPAFVEAVDTAVGVARTDLGADRATLTAAQRRNAAEQAELEEQLRQVETDTTRPPAAPAWRTAQRPGDRPGAPLWALVDVDDTIDDDTLAHLEAALTAAGLLDAWITPDGTVGDGNDSWIAAPPAPDAASTAGTLATLLHPAADTRVPRDVVQRVLTAIRTGSPDDQPSGARVAPDGQFTIGPLRGRAAPSPAEHLGAAARQRARERAREQAQAELDELHAAAHQLADDEQQLAARADRLDRERTAPSAATFTAATAQRQAKETAQQLRTADVATAEAKLTAAEQAVRAAQAALTQTASDRGLPADPDGLDRRSHQLDRVAGHITTWLDARERTATAATAAAAAHERARRTRGRAASADEDASREEGQLQELGGKLAAVEQSAQTHDRIADQVQQTREEQQQTETHVKKLTDRRVELNGTLATTAAQLETADGKRRQADEERAAAEQHLQALLHDDVHLDAGNLELDAEHVPTNTTALRQLGRRITELYPVPYDTKAITSGAAAVSAKMYEMRDALAGRAELTFELAHDDVQRLRAERDGARLTIAQLTTELSRELHAAELELTAAQKELFDRTLTGDVRRHVTQRIRMASDLEKHMNRLLATVSTASQLRVSLRWAPIDDETIRHARKLLLRDPDTLGDDDRDALHRFFRDRIEHARAADTAASWEEHLLQVLDYRTWHSFEVRIDRGDGNGPVPLTRARHGALSGGEKAISLHLPLFAAAAAHYATSPHAPRLVLLDELFVGVDEDNRGQLLALTTALDLDVVMTSDHEWCLYPELPALAIHELLTDDASAGSHEPVTSARFVWNGHDLIHDADAVAPTAADLTTADAADDSSAAADLQGEPGNLFEFGHSGD